MSNPNRFPEFVQTLPEVDFPFPGARGWLLQGADQQVVFLEIEETIEVPEHQHEEQWELVLAGAVELNCGGTVRRYQSGESFCIPAGTTHGATVSAGYRAVIVFNSPDRYGTKS